MNWRRTERPWSRRSFQFERSPASKLRVLLADEDLAHLLLLRLGGEELAELLQLRLAEAEAGEVEVEVAGVDRGLQRLQLLGQHLLVPAGVQRDPVVGQHQRGALLLGQAGDPDARDAVEAEPARRGHAPVAGDDDAVVVREDRVGEAEALDRGRELRDLLVGMGARVAVVAAQGAHLDDLDRCVPQRIVGAHL
ncbi:hypothetical protein NBEOAGPD_4473 [Methylobacterium gregans]|uniref:Uncharacterized protein n=1 Tax=Methylobacterium gregans TaxID=374424 RepID=A0AA37MCL7_9HYPH|nr:hypothetical protein NBEOAGPD_4473 [Methylobacterium gregans]